VLLLQFDSRHALRSPGLGAVQMFGRILTFWVFILAAFFPVMGAYVTLAGLCPIETMIQRMHSGISSP
jgi:hypothetical protein